ncbi:hypothetical protein SprV_0200720800 [Sparganum proliferum]
MSYGFESSPPTFSEDSLQQNASDNEMKMALQKLQTQAEFQNQVSNLTGRCWDLCYTGTPGTKMDDKRANCLKNCVERYIDVSVLLRNRFQALVGRMQQQQ